VTIFSHTSEFMYRVHIPLGRPPRGINFMGKVREYFMLKYGEFAKNLQRHGNSKIFTQPHFPIHPSHLASPICPSTRFRCGRRCIQQLRGTEWSPWVSMTYSLRNCCAHDYPSSLRLPSPTTLWQCPSSTSISSNPTQGSSLLGL
jgi:hypothetical protein